MHFDVVKVATLTCKSILSSTQPMPTHLKLFSEGSKMSKHSAKSAHTYSSYLQ